jgi:hypothetical protein
MNIGFILQEGERVNNFALAEAIYAECIKEYNGLDAKTVAKMILLQVQVDESEDTE